MRAGVVLKILVKVRQKRAHARAGRLVPECNWPAAALEASSSKKRKRAEQQKALKREQGPCPVADQALETIEHKGRNGGMNRPVKVNQWISTWLIYYTTG